MRPSSPLRAAAGGGLLALFAAASVLSGCDSGPSALPARDHSNVAIERAARDMAVRPAERAERSVRVDAPAPLYKGKPIWSANRKYSAEENAAYHFERNGADFGAKTTDEFVAKVHAFVTDPPKGVLTMTRGNGDKLFYDPKANTFAVTTRAGAPRTMFKPDDGLAYWARQKDREAKVASGRRGREDDA